MTKANDHTGGVDGASDAFASALWAFDYLHWHAAHGVVGFNSHNKSRSLMDTVIRANNGSFHFSPKADAFEAFNAGNQGLVLSQSIAASGNLNLTAYAVRAEDASHVTLINKEYDNRAQNASVYISAEHILGDIESMSLQTFDGNATARDGITLGYL